ncbi:MAG: cydC [Mycobacterium sp.]|nr:cydC [Mycobacterium sp.]
MPSADALVTTLRLLRPRLSRLLLAVALGVFSLASALALAGISAWLITRAWQMPPVLDLSVAVVAVRALGIARGVFHYGERLATHDTALHAAATAREGLYARLADGRTDTAVRLPSGELLTRVGADVDELSDVLVRAVLPISVAAVLSVAATTVVGAISPVAAAVLAVCLLVAGVLAPWLASHAVRAAESAAAEHHFERDAATMLALEHAPELRVSGRLADVIAESGRRQRDWGHMYDRVARPAALASAVPIVSVGISVLAAIIAGVGLSSAVAPTTVAVLMLLPLSAFEATTSLPGAAVQLTRSRMAAGRLRDLTGPDSTPLSKGPISVPAFGGRLAATDLMYGRSLQPMVGPVNLTLKPGARLAVTGASGSGKTTLLMTLAGLLPPQAGGVSLTNTPLDGFDSNQLPSAIAFFAEDAHVFATTVRDNLLVARGDATDVDLRTALEGVGLGRWLATLPDGLATVLFGGAQAISAGQRRRLLLARAVVSTVPIVLLDEPTEHLDAGAADAVLRQLLEPGGMLFEAHRTVVVATHHLPADIGCPEVRTGAGGYPDCEWSIPA